MSRCPREVSWSEFRREWETRQLGLDHMLAGDDVRKLVAADRAQLGEMLRGVKLRPWKSWQNRCDNEGEV